MLFPSCCHLARVTKGSDPGRVGSGEPGHPTSHQSRFWAQAQREMNTVGDSGVPREAGTARLRWEAGG